jgi:hypothetical protein
MNKTLLTLSAVGAAALLTACGGGSGGGSTTPPAATERSLSGVAVDELILNGIVKATKPDDTVLAEGRTSNEDGSYKLVASNYTGPVIVSVTCDGNSSLLIEGNRTECPETTDFHSIANLEGDEVTVNVSPLTEVAYQRADALTNGTITQESITQAISEVAAIFNVNPVYSDPTKGAYETMVQAFHNVADDQNMTIAEVLTALADDMEDGTVGNNAPAIATALATEMNEMNVTNPLADSNGTYEIPAAEDLEGIAAVRAFVQELRTQGTVMNDYFDEEADAVGKALDSVAIDTEIVVEYVAGMTDMILEAYEDDQSSASGNIEVPIDGQWEEVPVTLTKVANSNEWSYTATLDSKTFNGTFVLPPLPDGVQNTFNQLSATFNGDLPYVENNNIQTQKVSLNIELTKTAEGGTVKITDCKVTDAEGNDKLVLDSLTGSVGYHTDPQDADESIFDFVKLDSVTLSAKAGDYEATGTLSIPTYVENTMLKPVGGFGEKPTTGFYMMLSCPNGRINVSDDQTYVEINGTRYEPETFDPSYELSLGFDDLPGHLTLDEVKAALVTDANCGADGEPDVTQSHSWYEYSETLGNSGWVPKVIEFDGTIKNTSSERAAELNGKVTVDIKNAATLPITDLADISDEVAEKAELKVVVAAKHTMVNRPETTLNLTYETKADDDAKRHTFTGSFAHDALVLSAEGYMDKDTENGQVVFAGTTDIEATFILKDDEIVNGNIDAKTGSLVKQAGKVVASIENREDGIIIKYTDGYFESLF